MALITINEAKRQKPSKPTYVSTISQCSSLVNEAKDAHDVCVAVARYVRYTNDAYANRMLVRLRSCKSLIEAQDMYYKYLLSVEGNGVLKEYNSKFVRFKGTVIGGMECHSPRG